MSFSRADAAKHQSTIQGLGRDRLNCDADQLGQVFTHDIRAVGVDYDTRPLTDGLPTARCLIFVTPDAQRTMQTFLGACTQLGPEDVNMDFIASSKVVYLEGYLWDLPRAKAAMRDAALKAQKSGVKVSLTLSDAFCVGRFRDEFLELAEKYVDAYLWFGRPWLYEQRAPFLLDRALALVRSSPY